jgi:hypothetical protein
MEECAVEEGGGGNENQCVKVSETRCVEFHLSSVDVFAALNTLVYLSIDEDFFSSSSSWGV